MPGLHRSSRSVRLSGNRSFRYQYSTLVLLDTVSNSEIAQKFLSLQLQFAREYSSFFKAKDVKLIVNTSLE